MTYVKVKEHEGIVRDTRSNAILSIDDAGLTAYKARKKQFQKVDNMEDKIKHLFVTTEVVAVLQHEKLQ